MSHITFISYVLLYTVYHLFTYISHIYIYITYLHNTYEIYNISHITFIILHFAHKYITHITKYIAGTSYILVILLYITYHITYQNITLIATTVLKTWNYLQVADKTAMFVLS